MNPRPVRLVTSDPEPLPSTPVGAVSLVLRLPCQTVAEFMERHAGDLSRDGIYLRSSELLAVGTPVKLDLQLQDGTRLIVGDGKVLWTREPRTGDRDGTGGMGVRFGRLTQTSQDLIAATLAERARTDGSGTVVGRAPGSPDGDTPVGESLATCGPEEVTPAVSITPPPEARAPIGLAGPKLSIRAGLPERRSGTPPPIPMRRPGEATPPPVTKTGHLTVTLAPRLPPPSRSGLYARLPPSPAPLTDAVERPTPPLPVPSTDSSGTPAPAGAAAPKGAIAPATPPSTLTAERARPSPPMRSKRTVIFAVAGGFALAATIGFALATRGASRPEGQTLPTASPAPAGQATPPRSPPTIEEVRAVPVRAIPAEAPAAPALAADRPPASVPAATGPVVADVKPAAVLNDAPDQATNDQATNDQATNDQATNDRQDDSDRPATPGASATAAATPGP